MKLFNKFNKKGELKFLILLLLLFKFSTRINGKNISNVESDSYQLEFRKTLIHDNLLNKILSTEENELVKQYNDYSFPEYLHITDSNLKSNIKNFNNNHLSDHINNRLSSIEKLNIINITSTTTLPVKTEIIFNNGKNEENNTMVNKEFDDINSNESKEIIKQNFIINDNKSKENAITKNIDNINDLYINKSRNSDDSYINDINDYKDDKDQIVTIPTDEVINNNMYTSIPSETDAISNSKTDESFNTTTSTVPTTVSAVKSTISNIKTSTITTTNTNTTSDINISEVPSTTTTTSTTTTISNIKTSTITTTNTNTTSIINTSEALSTTTTSTTSTISNIKTSTITTTNTNTTSIINTSEALSTTTTSTTSTISNIKTSTITTTNTNATSIINTSEALSTTTTSTTSTISNIKTSTITTTNTNATSDINISEVPSTTTTSTTSTISNIKTSTITTISTNTTSNVNTSTVPITTTTTITNTVANINAGVVATTNTITTAKINASKTHNISNHTISNSNTSLTTINTSTVVTTKIPKNGINTIYNFHNGLIPNYDIITTTTTSITITSFNTNIISNSNNNDIITDSTNNIPITNNNIIFNTTNTNNIPLTNNITASNINTNPINNSIDYDYNNFNAKEKNQNIEDNINQKIKSEFLNFQNNNKFSIKNSSTIEKNESIIDTKGEFDDFNNNYQHLTTGNIQEFGIDNNSINENIKTVVLEKDYYINHLNNTNDNEKLSYNLKSSNISDEESNNNTTFSGMSSAIDKIKDDNLIIKIPKIPPLVTTTTTTTTITNTNNINKNIYQENNNTNIDKISNSTIINDLQKQIKLPLINNIETITIALLDSSFCKEKEDNYKQISLSLKENISKILSIHIQDIVIDEIYAENSNGFYSGNEKCTFTNGKLKGIIFDISIIKNTLKNYPTFKDIEKVSSTKTDFNEEYGNILIWQRKIDTINNEYNPFCQASLKEAKNIKFPCINHPVYCIHNNEYKCYTNPMSIDCYCYHEKLNNNRHEIMNYKNNPNYHNSNQYSNYDLNDYEITNECRAIITCTNDIVLPIISRCSSSPYSIGCPCNLNPYSKLCGCYINPFNPGCHCTYNPSSDDCKCLLKPEECKQDNAIDIDYEIVDRSPFNLKHGLRRFYKRHFRRSHSTSIFQNYYYYQLLLSLFFSFFIFNLI